MDEHCAGVVAETAIQHFADLNAPIENRRLWLQGIEFRGEQLDVQRLDGFNRLLFRADE